MTYTGACNALSLQRAAALKHCTEQIALLKQHDVVDEESIAELEARCAGLRQLLDAGCPA